MQITNVPTSIGVLRARLKALHTLRDDLAKCDLKGARYEVRVAGPNYQAVLEPLHRKRFLELPVLWEIFGYADNPNLYREVEVSDYLYQLDEALHVTKSWRGRDSY